LFIEIINIIEVHRDTPFASPELFVIQTGDTGIYHSTRMRFGMEKEDNHFGVSDKKFAAVCGLYCEACSWFIATTEDPERLKRMAAQLHFHL